MSNERIIPLESARTALESCPADMADIWEEFAERAAIMQYDGGMTMQEAETFALLAAFRRMGSQSPEVLK